MARASTVIGLTMLGAAGVGAATIPFMGSSTSGPQGIAGAGPRCSATRFATVAECQAAGHATCRPDGTMFVPTNCTTGSGSSGTRWYNSHPIYWFGGGRGGTTTTTTSGSGPQTVTTSPRTSGGSGGTTTTPGGTSSRGGFGSSSTSHGGGSS
ncbi:MAG: hypothetical protein FJX20_01070 [Alphaproteobacteria bacterium]|nr:hypothetical protein [Alphaproteobacteria bacterium]